MLFFSVAPSKAHFLFFILANDAPKEKNEQKRRDFREKRQISKRKD